MSNVLPFGPKSPTPDLAPNAGLVNSTGEKIQTPRSMQNEIIQRRNFILIDAVTNEIVVSNGNAVQAYIALTNAVAQILLGAVQQISAKVTVDILKQTASTSEMASASATNAVTENSPE